MEFNQLISFIKVVKHKSFSKAAEELYLTQPSISNNIQNLENELDTTLLDRKNKSISLTHSGEVLYRYAVELINMRNKAKMDISEQANKIEGKIEINASSIPEQYILPYIIKDFTQEYPLVTFSVNNKNSKEIVDDIFEARENFGIIGARYDSKSLEYINFYEDELVLAVPNNSKYKNIEALPIESLLTEKFIFRKEGSGTRLLVEESLSKEAVNLKELNIVSIIDNNEMIKKMIQLDLGVSFLSAISIENELKLKLIKALKVENLNLKRKFYFVYSKNRTLSPVVEVFKNFLSNWTGIDKIPSR